MQVYRLLDIGTAKPAPAQLNQARHHLFSIINPDQDFSAAQFQERAAQVIAEITARGFIPLVAGGTGLYLKALTKGLFPAPQADQALRNKLRIKARQQGREALYKTLQEKDPAAARKINPNDSFRIIRALEVFYQTGQPISMHQEAHGFHESAYAALKLGLNRNRNELYHRIQERVDRMAAQGLLEEVKSVLAQGYAPHLKPLQSIGYKQMVQFLQEKISWQEAIVRIKKETRHLAKRQLTWFRQDPEIEWISLPEQKAQIEVKVKNFLNIP